jgi:hypothetical protein
MYKKNENDSNKQYLNPAAKTQKEHVKFKENPRKLTRQT